MPPMNTVDEINIELFEIQHHLIPTHHNHHQSHTPTFVEEINAIFHLTDGIHHSNNGSLTTGSGGAFSGSSDGGITDDSYHFIIAVCLIVPLILTFGIIFIIALVVRKMRKAESLKEISSRHTNGFAMKEISISPTGSMMSSTSSSSPTSSSSMSLHKLEDASTSSGFSSSQSVPSSPTSSTTPQHAFNPPWFLYSTSYYRSQYNLNKLQHEMSSYIGSVQSLPTHSSSLSPYITEPLPNTLDDEESSKSKLKRSSSVKKFKRVFTIMNFPKRIRQHQADKNRFNIYTVPMETREQLKQIYVY